MLPDAFVGVPPEGDHFVDLQGPSGVGAAASRPQSAVFHLGQEVFGKGTAHVVVIAILKKTKTINNKQSNIVFSKKQCSSMVDRDVPI